MSCLEAYLTLRGSKRGRGEARNVGMSGYPYISSMENRSGTDEEK